MWDTIWTLEDLEAGRPLETWGGVGYSLAAAAAACPEGWEVVPVAKVGADLAEEARAYAAALPRVAVGPSLVTVEQANNRVELRYTSTDRRGERQTGGVPGWTWEELAPHVAGLDALFVNFLSGFEMDLETAEALRLGYEGPLYADLHSLFLGCPGAGVRVQRALPHWERWMACWDAVQLNEDERAMLPGALADRREPPVSLLDHGPGLVAVTLGPGGVTVAADPGMPDDPAGWPGWRGRRGVGGDDGGRETRGGWIAAPGSPASGDPTGCGDVWGATFFASLLGGYALEAAAQRAHAAAGRKLSHRGASGLHGHLVG